MTNKIRDLDIKLDIIRDFFNKKIKTYTKIIVKIRV